MRGKINSRRYVCILSLGLFLYCLCLLTSDNVSLGVRTGSAANFHSKQSTYNKNDGKRFYPSWLKKRGGFGSDQNDLTKGYTLGVRDSIMIAHSFHNKEFGPAQNMHGATYTVDVEFHVDRLTEKLNWVLDIGEALDALSKVLQKYNLKNLNEIFPDENTTTEFMCKQIHDDLFSYFGSKYNGEITVKLWESHKAWATYRGASKAGTIKEVKPEIDITLQREEEDEFNLFTEESEDAVMEEAPFSMPIQDAVEEESDEALEEITENEMEDDEEESVTIDDDEDDDEDDDDEDDEDDDGDDDDDEEEEEEDDDDDDDDDEEEEEEDEEDEDEDDGDKELDELDELDDDDDDDDDDDEDEDDED